MPLNIDSAIGDGLARGQTLPAPWYADPAIFAAERERIFNRSWQYAGHLGQVARPGDFFTAQIGDVPIVVTRDGDAKLRAFANVCRHRGSEVVLECSGNRRTLQCHYHGWTYNLDGSLRNAPRADEQESFAKESLGLLPLGLDTLGPLVFVNPNRGADPFSTMIGNLPRTIAQAGVDLSQMRWLRRDVYEFAANWKIVIENFNECYHCPIAHPKFSEFIDTDKYRSDTSNEFVSTYFGPYFKPDGAGVTYATLWPNAMLAASLNPMALQVICAHPIDAGHTHETVDYFFAEGTTEPEIRNYAELSDLVTREDVVLCESVQRGMRSGVIEHGSLMLSRERGIQHFQGLVYKSLR
ncbi:MAG: aromatic ring-hydroxylating oxygenase subunit alpha [Candidatus Binataceae bacterium]